MTDVTLEFATTDTQLCAVRQLCWDYRDFLLGFDPDVAAMTAQFYPREAYAALMGTLADEHARPHGMILLASMDGVPAACGMTKTLAPGVAELKRVFVTPAARGQHLGRRICDRAIEQLRADRMKRLHLDTARALAPARALYENMGFVPCAPYYDAPPKALPFLCFYEMTL